MQRTFSASLEQLYSMLAFIRERAISAGFEPLIIARLELAGEDALVNIISYAYPEGQGSIEILCSEPGRPGIQIALRDQGIAYNPLRAIKSVHTKDELGGYGIPLIVRIMDKVEYARENSDNVLTLVKYLESIR